jgi:hypothetical protein
VSLQTDVFLTKEYNVIVNSEELIGTTKYVVSDAIDKMPHKPMPL